MDPGVRQDDGGRKVTEGNLGSRLFVCWIDLCGAKILAYARMTEGVRQDGVVPSFRTSPYGLDPESIFKRLEAALWV